MSGVMLATYIALWVIVVGQTILILVLYRQLGIMVMGTSRGVNDSGIPVGRRLPALSLRTLADEEWTPALHSDRPLLVFFGGHYCESCKEVLPYLEELRSEGLEIATLLMGDIQQSRVYAREMHLKEPVAVIDEETTAKFDVEVTPFAYAIDVNGVIRAKGVANNHQRLREFADKALGRESQSVNGEGSLPANGQAAQTQQLVVNQRRSERP